jgi:AAA+ ATPase superfamily predicted ATPase
VNYFIGREDESLRLKDLLQKKTASMVTIQGRRRIGKSTLIRNFAKSEGLSLFEFQGLPPRKKMTNQEQLNEFSKHLANSLNIKKMVFLDWTQALVQLNLLCIQEKKNKKKCIILLDEISWMGSKDPDFSGYLKDVWDRVLSQNQNLILVICGSVSSWIEKNILKNTGFVGRISKEFRLQELSIAESYQFLKKSLPSISVYETAQILSITGGVPKYIEEFSPYKSVDIAIKELCFHPTGFLFKELDSIFSEIFEKKSNKYLKILEELEKGAQTPLHLAEKLKLPVNGDWTEMLEDLELGGFICRDFNWNFDEKPSHRSTLRISDNYTKFYLKYIKPKKNRLIKQPLKPSDSLSWFPWATVFGLQFESLMLNNLNTLIRLARIPNDEIVQLGPFFQAATKKKSGVQIDCLIQCKKGQLHLFEFKSGKSLGLEIVNEAKEKNIKLKIPKNFSIRNYLVYLGDLSEPLMDSDFFDKKISFKEFL